MSYSLSFPFKESLQVGAKPWEEFGSIQWIQPLKGGLNNQLYLIQFENSKKVVLKKYFSHPQDFRPRLFHEYTFLQFCKRYHIVSVPIPLWRDESQNLGLYSFVPGNKISPKNLTWQSFFAYIQFIKELNSFPLPEMPFASEACLSLQDYLQTARGKLTRIAQETSSDPFLQAFEEWRQKELMPLFHQIEEFIQGSSEGGRNTLSKEQLIISPSDVGFHNVLAQGSPVISKEIEYRDDSRSRFVYHSFYFIDFEYSGLDDPAKTFCDLLLNPYTLKTRTWKLKALQSFCCFVKDPIDFQRRVELVYDLCQLKWIGIVLNIFHKISNMRRTFATQIREKELQKQWKLAKMLLLPLQQKWKRK